MTERRSEAVRVILADDHPMVLDGVGASLATFDHIDVVGMAADGDEAVALAAELRPDIALMDINMPNCNGLRATELIGEKAPDTRVVIFTMHENREYIEDAKARGACGYVLKSASAEEIVEAIITVAEGSVFYCKGVEAILEEQETRAHALTARERSILALLANGGSNKHVARELGISVRTVETHRKNIKRKLGISSTAGLAKYAMETGLV